MAKGFGGKYFSLQAITATVNATTLHNRAVRTQTCHSYRSYMSDASPPDELDILLEAIEPFTPKVSRCQCHCNCFFRRRTRCALYVSSLTPKLRFLFRYFHTDTSPPLPFSFSY
jgi:hypothetical protein